eukprot:4484906-Prymnesium_polylepis.1
MRRKASDLFCACACDAERGGAGSAPLRRLDQYKRQRVGGWHRADRRAAPARGARQRRAVRGAGVRGAALTDAAEGVRDKDPGQQ